MRAKQLKGCPNKSKVCSSVICFMTDKGNYICCGVSSKPTKCKDDVVWLCLKSRYTERSLEMTTDEANGIISALALGIHTVHN